MAKKHCTYSDFLDKTFCKHLTAVFLINEVNFPGKIISSRKFKSVRRMALKKNTIPG